MCMLPFPDGDASRHGDLSWFGQEKALRPAGDVLYYFAPKCLYRGEYKRIRLRVLTPSRLWECKNDVLHMLSPVLSMPDVIFYSPRRGPGL